VEDIAVPVWDKYLLHNPITDERESIDHSLMLEVDGSVIDSKNYLITDDKFEIINAADYFKVSPWAGETLHYNFSHHHPDSALLGGFYHAEGWGIWSRMATPWLFLETQISGAFKVAFRARGFGATVGKIVTIEIGGVTQSFELAAESTAYVLNFLNVSPCNIIRFVGLDLTPPGYDYDSRSMALGLENMSITDLSNIEIAQLRPSNPVKLRVDGVVYTSVFNPVDARKNWEDIVSAFCYAHADNARATLILKVTHLNLSSIMGRLHFLLQKIGRVDCRVIAIQGFLPDDNFNQLIKNTSFYVNASSAEGLCLPLLEFMAAGVPAIAPKHTAMEDYIDEYSSFVVDTSKEPTIWPHDPRGLKRATSNRINWSSLATQFQETFDCAMSAPEQYLIKSVASRENVKKCTEGSMIKYKLDNFLNKI
jgi:glycosyltransferase involved in cell wall biosynthesis